MTPTFLFSPKHIIFILFLFSTLNLFGQSPYEISTKKDIPLLLGGTLGTWLGDRYIQNNVSPFTAEEIELLDAKNINGFDRIATRFNSSTARSLSDVFLYSSFAYPALVLFSEPIKKDFLSVGIMGVETIGWTITITTFTKGLVKRKRPLMYNTSIPNEAKLASNGRLSFFSGHTAEVAAISFFTAKVVNDYYPDSKWKRVIWSVAVVLPATTGYLRVRGGKHYPSDVITGMAVGGVIGILIPHLHKKKKNKKNRQSNLSIFPSGNNIGLVLTW